MPISDCQVRDPRIRRTRKLLQGALGTLMHSKSFDEISVQDITDAATVNRATFYDHYTDKYALLDAMIAGGFHEFLFERQLRYETGCPGALGGHYSGHLRFSNPGALRRRLRAPDGL